MKWPRTLFGRNLLLLISLLVCSQIAWLALFRFAVQTPRLERLASYMLEQNELLNYSLSRLPETERAGVLAALSTSKPGLLMAAETAPSQFKQPPTRRTAILLAPLAKALGPGHTLHWQRSPEQRLWIRTQLDRKDYWMGFSTAGLVPETGTLLASGSLLTVIFAILGAAFIQRHLHRPLQQLAAAAAAVAQGKPLAPLSPEGPREIATVASAFTHMTESLARADAERALMLAGVSHDLRTPLAKLRLCTEMLRPNADNELIDTMTRSIESADAIIGQFIDFARIGSDETLQLCDPAEILLSVAKDAGGTPAPSLSIETTPPLLVRPIALRRALANLIENARRYAPGELTLSLAQHGNFAHFSVQDRGPGIPEAQLARARQPFARLVASRGNHPGAGLGLAIVERIAYLHGGRLELAPREGGGLAATIVLPLSGNSASA